MRWTIAVVACLVGLAIAACYERPLREGPQLRRFPEGMKYDGNMSYGRLVFPERKPVRQRGYMSMPVIGEDGPHTSIAITEYAGVTTEDEALRAQQAIAIRYPRDKCTAIEPVTIDGRPAWGWFEHQYDHKSQERASLEWNVIVSYDATTYTIEFFSNDPKMWVPEMMKDVVSSFVVGPAPKS
jgi:hypothetical protein